MIREGNFKCGWFYGSIDFGATGEAARRARLSKAPKGAIRRGGVKESLKGA